MDTGVHIVRRRDWEPAAAGHPHLFFTGDLRQPNPIPFVRDSRAEFIACTYSPGDDGRYHWHAQVTEYELILEGRVGYAEAASGTLHWFGAGDFLSIPPGVCVQRRVPGRARTVAVKIPSTPEKVHCPDCPRECAARVEPYQDR